MQDSDRFTRMKLPHWITLNVYNEYGLGAHRHESDNRLWISAYKRTAWIRLSDGLNTSHSHRKRLCGKEHLVRQGQDVSMKHIMQMKEGTAFDYFVTTISTRPSRRSMLMPTSFA